ncbi:hypothetical protein BV378_18670 [Nostoc sp. RF31YmG]|nr:hypothetical protein BV378_18670 [Nostoc sp. RF31YmG]
MTESTIYKLIDVEVSKLNKSVNSLIGIINICRLVGYSLLILVFFDLIDIFFPLQIMNPVWEFQTMGALVERVAIPLVSLLLVFSGKLENRLIWELPILGLISRLTLLVGLLYILLIPLGVSDSIRLYNSNLEQFNKEYSQQVSQTNQIEQQITQATPAELDNIIKRQGQSLNSKSKNSQDVKKQLLLGINQAKQQIKTQAESKKPFVNLKLLKSSVKWNLGALISGFLFIAIWKGTAWARGGEGYS